MRIFRNIILFFIFSFELSAQTKIIQSVERTKNDSCIIFTKLEAKDGKVYKSEAKCKFSEFDSLKVIERKRAKLIAENFNWKN